jgi:hypothetical protein
MSVTHACTVVRGRRGRWICAAAAYFIAAAAGAADVSVLKATIEPSRILVGESAELTITRLGGGAEPLNLPRVAGLTFRVVGQTHHSEIIDNSALATTTTLVRVTPQAAGTYAIPGFASQSQALLLRVTQDYGGGAASGAGPAGASAGSGGGGQEAGGGGGSRGLQAVPSVRSATARRPPVTIAAAGGGGLRMAEDDSAFVRLILPKADLFVGESLPVEIELGMHAGFVSSLNGLPTLDSAEFTLNNLSRQPERAERAIDGKPFVILLWHSVLAAVKAGTYSLSVAAPLTVKIRTRPKPEARLDDLLGDPFLQNVFGATVKKDLEAVSVPQQITVAALPAEGRPPGFNGAVGRFAIATDLSPATAAAGDPLTLRLHVTGSGNFDRVDSPMLQTVEHWKTYPPKSSFKPHDALGEQGEKTFEQPLVPLRAGAQTLPPLAFGYFDPSTRRYEVARSSPLAVMIAPSPADAAVPAAARVASGAPPDAITGAAAGDWRAALRPDHAVPPGVRDSLLPLYLQPRFLALNGVLALAFVGGWFGLRRRESVPDGPGRARGQTPSRAVEIELAQMEAAARRGDRTQFFQAARSALQMTLAARWELAADAVTGSELDGRLGAAAADVRGLFALADEAQYSGGDPNSTDFAFWAQVVRRQTGGAGA